MLTAAITLLILLVLSFYFSHRPTYQATISNAQKTTLWIVRGNPHYIDFISINPATQKNQHFIAWLKKPQQSAISIGVIPRDGGKNKKRVALPKVLAITAGDQIIISAVRADTQTIKEHSPKQAIYSVQLETW